MLPSGPFPSKLIGILTASKLMTLSTPSQVRREIGLFIGFLCVALIFRFWTFFQSGLDWDESLYMLVSQSVLNGKLPYVEIWDNKPVGIYLIYVLSFLFFGKSVFTIRLISCIAIAVTCYILYHLGRLFENQGKLIGFIAALIYIVAILKNDGAAANTEIFFIPFVTAAYYLTFTQQLRLNYQPTGWKYFVIGLLMGIAFIIKYVVIYDLFAILLLLAIQTRSSSLQRSDRNLSTIRVLSIVLLGVLLPFLLMTGFFTVAGYFSDFFYANFTANKIRNIDRNFSLSVILQTFQSQLCLNIPLWLCFGLTFLLPFARALSWTERKVLRLLAIWIVIPLLGIFLTFKVRFYAHYFLPLLPPLSLITAFFLVKVLLGRQPKVSATALTERSSKYLYKQSLLLMVAVASLTSFYGISSLKKNAAFFYFSGLKGIPHYEDKAAEVAEYLQDRITPNDYIYVADYDPVVYFLSNAQIPTKYAYPFFLIGDNLPKVAGVNPIQELSALMKKQPLYVVIGAMSKETEQNRSFYSKLKQWLEKDYRLEQSDNQVKLYRRKALHQS